MPSLQPSIKAPRYSATAITLHWVIALATIAMLCLGWWMVGIPKDPPGPRVSAFNLHKSIGITILLLMIVRLAWRASHRPPEFPTMPSWQVHTARTVHWLLYASLFVMPLAGFTASSFSGRPILFFGAPLPVVAGKSPHLAEFFYGVHYATSWILIGAVVLHVAAAMRHQLVLRDGLVWRMWPLRKSL